jgi:hypothetical protein
MHPTNNGVRRGKRLPLTLPIRVLCRESTGYEWIEQSRLIDVNHFGAGFTLTRPIDIGRLVRLTIPLPHQLRCFDHIEPMYSVWSLVRHAAAITRAEHQDSVLFRIGVGFIGKAPPLSYEMDPSLRYDPMPARSGAAQNSLWKLGMWTAPNQRREERLVIPIEVQLEALDENGKPAKQEYTVTEKISSLGACVPTNLDVGVGRIVKMTSVRDPISVFAAIRSRVNMPDGFARLGLEFIGERWPLLKD